MTLRIYSILLFGALLCVTLNTTYAKECNLSDFGTNYIIDGNATVLADGESVNITCKSGLITQSGQESSFRVQCRAGNLLNTQVCNYPACNNSWLTVDNAKYDGRVTSYTQHGASLAVECNAGYYVAKNGRDTRFFAICDGANKAFKPESIKSCVQKCTVGSKFGAMSSIVYEDSVTYGSTGMIDKQTTESSGLIDSDRNITIMCKDGYISGNGYNGDCLGSATNKCFKTKCIGSTYTVMDACVKPLTAPSTNSNSGTSTLQCLYADLWNIAGTSFPTYKTPSNIVATAPKTGLVDYNALANINCDTANGYYVNSNNTVSACSGSTCGGYQSKCVGLSWSPKVNCEKRCSLAQFPNSKVYGYNSVSKAYDTQIAAVSAAGAVTASDTVNVTSGYIAVDNKTLMVQCNSGAGFTSQASATMQDDFFYTTCKNDGSWSLNRQCSGTNYKSCKNNLLSVSSGAIFASDFDTSANGYTATGGAVTVSCSGNYNSPDSAQCVDGVWYLNGLGKGVGGTATLKCKAACDFSKLTSSGIKDTSYVVNVKSVAANPGNVYKNGDIISVQCSNKSGVGTQCIGCATGFNQPNVVGCYDGVWSGMLKCTPLCQPRVLYYDQYGINSDHDWGKYVAIGEIISPSCKKGPFSQYRNSTATCELKTNSDGTTYAAFRYYFNPGTGTREYSCSSNGTCRGCPMWTPDWSVLDQKWMCHC